MAFLAVAILRRTTRGRRARLPLQNWNVENKTEDVLFKKKKKSFAHSLNLLLIIHRARLLTTHISANPRWPRLLHPQSSQTTDEALTFRPEKWSKESLILCPTLFPCNPEPPGTEKLLLLTFPTNCLNSPWLKLRLDKCLSKFFRVIL